MKKKRLGIRFPQEIAGGRILLIMKLSLFMVFFSIASLSANESVMSQRVTLDFRNAELSEVLRSIKTQTGLMVIYDSDDIGAEKRRVTVDLLDVPLNEALDAVLTGMPYTYAVEDGSVLIIPAPKGQVPIPNVTITGTVTNAEGKPLRGASVFIGGTRIGTVTDAMGRFSLSIPNMEGVVIRFSCVGKKDAALLYDGRNEIRIALENEVTEIGEVVVTGYQTIDREKITGSVTTVTADELSSRYMPNLLDNLEGRVAGLVSFDGRTRIRGSSSIHAEGDPLLVVDGVPIEGGIETLNPYDIENVNVLKDAAAAAIYGARASNGIIVVTTKHAKTYGKVDVDVSANFTAGPRRNLDYHDNFYMNPVEQVETEMKTWQNAFIDDVAGAPAAIAFYEFFASRGYLMAGLTPIQHDYYEFAKGLITRDELDSRMEQYKKNNFAKEYAENVLRSRFMQQYNVAARYRSDVFASSVVFNYRHDNTGTIKAFSDRFGVFYKCGYDASRWLTINFSTDIAFGKEKSANNSEATDPFNVPAYMSLLNDDGSYNYYSRSMSNIYHTQWEDEPGLRFNGFNHLEEIENGYDDRYTRRLDARIHGELVFRIIPGLTANTQFAYEAGRENVTSNSKPESYVVRMLRNIYTTKSYDDVYEYALFGNGGKLYTSDTRNDNWTARGQLNFVRTFNDKHAVNFLAGMEFRQTLFKGVSSLLLNYDDQLLTHSTDRIDYPALNDPASSSFYGDYAGRSDLFLSEYILGATGPKMEQYHRYASAYGNVTYTFDGRYNLFASLRSDYADIYGLDTRFRGKPLWSAGASWNMEREKFMENVPWVDMLKLRLSYGITGNIYQGATSYLTAYSGMINYVTWEPMSMVGSPANSELRWEQTATLNLGVDFRLWQNRIRGSIDLYNKKGTDIFANKELDASKGFTSMAMNAASMLNRGVELALSVDWFRPELPGGFGWTTSATFAYNKNKVTVVDNPASTAWELLYNPLLAGYPVTAVFSSRYGGINDNGWDYLYLNGDETVETIYDMPPDVPGVLVYSGQEEPKYSFGMENMFRYRNFSLNFTMVYYGGHVMRTRVIAPQDINYMPYSPLDIAFLNSWTPENKDTDIPGIGQYGGGGYVSIENYDLDLFVHSAAFLKIRNIVLGYDLPYKLLSKIGLSRAALSFQIDNPKALYIANKVGVDPETGGIRVPTSFVFGLNISF